ncbi:ABC transporter ATP-binding protein [Dactylosporangium sp. NPDC000555]|uniref:ABC transporter ATP-binding protein n=1 Tax=Dactylosporangium sp. NPDC000555 TaxID=3154260 RepID=UPI00331A4A4F
MLSIHGLSLSIDTARGKLSILHDVSLQLARGETLGIVGESGSGKSMTVNAVLGLLPHGARIDAGAVVFLGKDMGALDEKAKRALRGSRIGTILQDPTASLNPALRIGHQVSEPLRVHGGASASQAHEAAVDLIERVGIPDAQRRVRQYPHQFSGGMRQRIVGASAISCKPDLLIADEPTTALDVTVQAAYLDLLSGLQAELGAGLLFISHDLGVVSRICDRAAVMYAGRVVETAATRTLFSSARHPYTMGLVSCLPSITEVGQRLTPIPGNPPDPAEGQAGCPFANRCPAVVDRCVSEIPALREIAPGHQVACHRADEGLRTQQLWPVTSSITVSDRDDVPERSDRTPPTLELSRAKKLFTIKRTLLGTPSVQFCAVDSVDLQVFRGESVSVVGESGSGKTTCIRMALGLEQPTSGVVCFEGKDIARLDRPGRREYRRRVQAVFQDPYTSFNPRMSIARVVAEPLMELGDMSRQDISTRVDEVLAQVGLEPRRVRDCFPHQLSGGQRQRVAIARALSTKPHCLVLDEPVSALDVSIRVQILNLLRDVQQDTGVGILSISHDLGAVKYMSDRVIVMHRGVFVEEGTAEQIYHRPQHEYTQKLLADAAAGLGVITS